MTTAALPWHDALWQKLYHVIQQQRLPHALLLIGKAGVGKMQFAKRLVDILLCETGQQTGQACGHCKGCDLIKANTHPDLFMVEPAETGKQIPIQRIRELIEFCTLTANYGQYHIAVIQPAEAMNINAANSLLKLLEEPPPSTLLVLVSHQPMKLLATIRSRCQRIDFNHPDKQQVQMWLQQQVTNQDIQPFLEMADYAPFTALSLAKSEGMQRQSQLFKNIVDLTTGQHDPINIATTWQKQDTTQLIQWMLTWTMDLIRYNMTGQVSSIANQHALAQIQGFSQGLNLQKLFKLLDLQVETYRLINSNNNIKPQNLLESLAIAWFELMRGRHKCQLN